MKHIYLLFTCLLLMTAGSLSAATGDPLEGVCGRRVQYNQDSTNLRWKVDTIAHTLTITGKGRMRDYDTDTRAPWYPWRNYIYKATFPNGMTTVGSYAMYELSKLTDIQWGNTETIIYTYAFHKCSSLPQLTLPSSLTSIEDFAFWQCSSLKSVLFGDKVKTVGQCAFWSCSNIETIDFGESPANIGEQAFQTASALISIKAKCIKTIGTQAFEGCMSLVELQLGDSLYKMNTKAFYSCHSLQSVHFPATFTDPNFTARCFEYCYALDKITVDSKNPYYDSRNNCNAMMRTADNTLIFGCCKTQIPEETITISDYAFAHCKRLESLAFPKDLQSIQSFAFSDCSGLQSIVLPEGLQLLGEKAFSGCSALSSANLPNSVKTVNCEVFLNCYALKTPIYNTTYFVFLPTDYEGTYTIPGKPQKIACGAFENCTNLTTVQIPSSVTDVNGSAFKNCTSLKTILLPDGVTFLGSSAFYSCSSLPSITIPQGIKTINSSTFEGCSSLPSIIIPDGVTKIDYKAFDGCSSLISITFPSALTSFGGSILQGCSKLRDITWNVRQYSSFSTGSSSDPFNGIRGQITDFTFGDSVRVIPANLCNSMSKLSTVSLGANIEKVGDNTFYGCKGIKSVHWNVRAYPDPQIYTQSAFYTLHDSITTFTFGDSVRHIPAYLCHSMNRLRQLRISKNVSSIGRFAFRYVSTLDSISVDENNTDYDSRNDCNALIETSSDVLLLGCYKTQIPDDISGVGECAFRNVRKLNVVELPETTTFVGPEAFNGCLDLKDLTLSENIETIDDYAFQDCDSLTVITLPSELKQVGLRAFANCTQLQSVVVNATTPPTIDATSFSNTTCPFQVPCAAIPTYRQAPVWSDFGSRVTGQAVFTLTVEQNDYGAGKTTIVQQPNCERNAIVEAEPERGYYFAGWQDKSGTILSTDVRYEFPLEDDLTIIAVFLSKVQSIDEVLQDNTAVWYDIMGHKVATPTASGVYVVQQGSETFKVVIP